MNRHTGALAIALGVTAGLVPVAAEAKLDDGGTWTFSSVDSFDDCGIEGIDHTFEGRGVYKLRTIADNGDTEWLFQSNDHAYETFTNPANGRWFSITTRANHRETDGHQVDGALWEFDTKTSGASTTVRDEHGNLVFRDSGTYETTFLFDTLDDGQPGGVVLVEDYTGFHGRFTFVSWCEDLVEPLLG